jgi:hypothetical protein
MKQFTHLAALIVLFGSNLLLLVSCVLASVNVPSAGSLKVTTTVPSRPATVPAQVDSPAGDEWGSEVPVTGPLTIATYAPGSSAGYQSHEITPGRPAFSGMTHYCDEVGGFCLWLPNDWHTFPQRGDFVAVKFSPYPNDPATYISAEKFITRQNGTEAELPRLREAFLQPIQALSGVEIETHSESLATSLSIFEARFTFLDGASLRKRWVKTGYKGSAVLVLTAQGRDPGDFAYWLPIFTNILLNVEW